MSPSATGIGDMPVEIIRNIGEFLSQPESACLAQTSKYMSCVVSPIMYERDLREDNHALWWACASNNTRVLKRFLRTAKQFTGTRMVNYRFRTQHSIANRPGCEGFSRGMTPIAVAIRFGSFNVFTYLLKSGANVNLADALPIRTNSHCWYPINWATHVVKPGGDFTICARLLAEYGATLDQQPLAKSVVPGPSRGYRVGEMSPVFEQLHFQPGDLFDDITYLHRRLYDLLDGRLNKLTTLLHLGIDPDKVELHTGHSPIFRLAMNLDKFRPADHYDARGSTTLRQELDSLYDEVIIPYSIDFLDNLVKAGGNVDLTYQGSAVSETALHVVCNKSELHQAVISFLVDLGADINATDENGRTPFYRIMANPPFKTKVLWKFIHKNVAINHRDQNGQTPLHFLCENYGMSMALLDQTIKALVKAGADLLAKDNNGKTPCDLLKDRRPRVLHFIVDELEEAEGRALKRAEGRGRKG
ncbi:ankyrin repeat-containing domain protein [Hypoxylon trugodes]|uniref:ankyrin repeat-containing domain protein n=1 Tax=Hypoxylon trugodes TaxID=326681 RepID=UPI0021A00B74|nr:ankyrin repeat-containing domain protein [Hypoxylon trugodes]KAI1383914.1 ankyrin repeat-containing domain protein [Hypoxylon trugodes]